MQQPAIDNGKRAKGINEKQIDKKAPKGELALNSVSARSLMSPKALIGSFPSTCSGFFSFLIRSHDSEEEFLINF